MRRCVLRRSDGACVCGAPRRQFLELALDSLLFRRFEVLIMRPSFLSTIAVKSSATALIVSSVLMITGCIHRSFGRVLPPVMLGDTRTKRNLVVGQVFFERDDGLLSGPNLQNLGLAVRSVPVGLVSVSQPDITLREFLSAIGASSRSCEASLPLQKSEDEKADWFQGQQQKLIGEDVSLLFEDVSNEFAEPASLEQLFEMERYRLVGKVPWSSTDNSPKDLHDAVAVIQAVYAKQVTIRFRVPEKNDLQDLHKNFLWQPSNSPSEIILALTKMISACAPQARFRELPDPGGEVKVAFPARVLMGVRLAGFSGSQVVALSQIETEIHLYEATRLPVPSHPKERGAIPGTEHIWTVDSNSARDRLGQAPDKPDEGSLFVKYCHDDNCVGIITKAREFDTKGRAYKAVQPHGCVIGNTALSWNPISDLSRLLAPMFQREVKLRELVLFFGPPPEPNSGADVSDYTSTIVLRQPNRVVSAPKYGPTTAVWIYEYGCNGGVAKLYSDPPEPLTNLTVSEHLEKWGLNK